MTAYFGREAGGFGTGRGADGSKSSFIAAIDSITPNASIGRNTILCGVAAICVRDSR